MSNFEAHENLSAYLDGMLSGPELAQMEEALAADADLRAELEELREMVQGLGSLPTHEAPAGLMAGVLASVADLPIPTADGADLGSGPGESTELVAPVAEPLPSNVVRLAWFKAPAVATALAASLVFGFVWITQQSDPAGAPEPAAFEAAVAEAPPQPSGVVPGDEFDAVADLGVAEGEEHARERLAGRLAGAEEKPELLESAEPDVMNGAAGAAAPPAVAEARPAPAPRRESVPESVVGPDGVFEADWESGDAVADADAPEEEMGEPGPAEVAFAPEPPGGALAAADPSVDDVTLDDEPLEDFTDPPGDEELLEVASAAAPASSGAMRRGAGGGAWGGWGRRRLRQHLVPLERQPLPRPRQPRRGDVHGGRPGHRDGLRPGEGRRAAHGPARPRLVRAVQPRERRPHRGHRDLPGVPALRGAAHPARPRQPPHQHRGRAERRLPAHRRHRQFLIVESPTFSGTF